MSTHVVRTLRLASGAATVAAVTSELAAEPFGQVERGHLAATGGAMKVWLDGVDVGCLHLTHDEHGRPTLTLSGYDAAGDLALTDTLTLPGADGATCGPSD